MSATRDGWYISDTLGNTVGPLTRVELVAQHARGAHGVGAVAWHPDLSEWRALERIAAATAPEMRAPQTTSAERAEARAEARVVRDRAEQVRAKQPRAEKRDGSVRRTDASSAPSHPARADDGKRLLAAKTLDAEALKRLPPEQRAEAIKQGIKENAGDAGARAGIAMRRFLARALDTLTLGVAAAAVLWSLWAGAFIAGLGFTLAPEPYVLGALALFAWVPVEALALAFFGTTPGKALMRLEVRRNDGAKPDVGTAFGRAARLLFRGLGLGLPLIGFITMIVAFARFVGSGRTSWDRDLGLDVRAAPIEAWRWQAALFGAFLAVLVLSSGYWGEIASSPFAF